jgi:integrase
LNDCHADMLAAAPRCLLSVAADLGLAKFLSCHLHPPFGDANRSIMPLSYPYYAFYVVAVTAGLRPSEMLALRWSDVDLEAGTLRVNRALSGGEFASTKTSRSRRKIELSNTARATLRAHRKRQVEEQLKKAGLWKDHGLVFPSTVGTPLSHRNVVRSFKAVLRRAGLPATIRLYDLRHTCATLLLCRNVHPKYVQELLGHASIAQTLDTYSHVLPGMDGGIGDAMDDALG